MRPSVFSCALRRSRERQLQRQLLDSGVSPTTNPVPRYCLRDGVRRGGRAAGGAGHDTTVSSSVEPLADSARAPPPDAFLPLRRTPPPPGSRPFGPASLTQLRINGNDNDIPSTGRDAFPTPRRALTLARSSPVPLPITPGRGTSLGQQPLAHVRARRGSSRPDPGRTHRRLPPHQSRTLSRSWERVASLSEPGEGPRSRPERPGPRPGTPETQHPPKRGTPLTRTSGEGGGWAGPVRDPRGREPGLRRAPLSRHTPAITSPCFAPRCADSSTTRPSKRWMERSACSA